METLIGTFQNPYLSINTNSFLRNQKLPILLHKNINTYQSTWKINAEAKGFGNNNVPAAEKYTSKRTNRRNNNNDDDNDDKIPGAVWQRIIGRILFYVGAPMVGGIIMLQVLSIVKENKLWDVPVWFPFLTTFITFGASALGVAYGTLSASWDADKQGSFLGFEQAQKNWVDMWAEDGNEEEENKWIN